MNKCIECGAPVRNSDAICQDCLDVAAAWVSLLEFQKEGGKPMADVEKDMVLKERGQ